MIAPAGDGWRYHVPCRGECGASVVVTGAYLGARGWCITCGRERWQAPVPQRPPPGWTRDNGLRLGQGGVNAYPVAVIDPALPPAAPSRIVESLELTNVDDPRLPAAAVALCERVGGRMLLSVARRSANPDTASYHVLDQWLSVQWRPAGKPPTVMAFWRNGRRDRAMIAGRETSHTEVGAL